MKLSIRGPFLVAALVFIPQVALLHAQGSQGRVFLPTPNTIAIYEFNGFPELPDGVPIPTGTTIPDLSGEGLNATVEANDSGDLTINAGSPEFDNPAGANRECRRSNTTSAARVAVNDDNDAFEFFPTDDFSIELFVNREITADAANWGILAGTWHSRNLLEDSTADATNNGAWYGYGLIRTGSAPGGGQWTWVLSPVVDGVPTIGLFNNAERPLQPPFDIPDGRHYVVLSVDRAGQLATAYIDGVQISSLGLDPSWSFTTPDGYEHARFLMFSGEDDGTLGSYRSSPAGTHLDAVRVQNRALTVDDVLETWSNMEAGLPSPPTEPPLKAIVVASSQSVLVNQCVVLNAESSTPGEGQTITKYEWQVGAGPFVEGTARHEVSFNAPTTGLGVLVTLRVTNSASATSTGSVRLRVRNADLAAVITATHSEAGLQAGRSIEVPPRGTLTLDGTASFTRIPAGTLVCPVADMNPVPASPITEYRWNTDTDPEIEFTTPSINFPITALGQFVVELTVLNSAGVQASTSITIKVADSGGNTSIFHNTPDTIVHFEFNDVAGIDGDPLLTGDTIEDLSGNGLDAIVEANEPGDLTINAGAPVFDSPPGSNREVRRVGNANNQPRLAINEDFDSFEMDPTEDFTIELYVNRETVDGGANWGILAGTWHSRNVLDDEQAPTANDNGAWYGYGLIRNDKLSNPPFEWAWVLSPVVDGIPRIGFGQAPEQQLQPFFDIAAGRHYVVLSMSRTTASAAAYVDGVQVAAMPAVPPEWSFTTPDGYEHARFMLFAGEDDPTRSEYRGSPAGTHLDAVRVQGLALTAEQVLTNWEDISSGRGADASTVTEQFRRGDGDGVAPLNISDPIYVLNNLFSGGPVPPCPDAADGDDSGALNITDPIRVLNFLFAGGPPPPAPGPGSCGPDPTADGLGPCNYSC